MLSGFVIIALTVMAKSAMNRLWQQTLMATAADALASAASLGFEVQPLGHGPRIRAVGMLDGAKATVEWRGGLRGETCWLRIGRHSRRVALIRTAQDWRRVIAMEE